MRQVPCLIPILDRSCFRLENLREMARELAVNVIASHSQMSQGQVSQSLTFLGYRALRIEVDGF